MWLGGDDIDHMIVEHVLQQTAREQRIDALGSLLDRLSATDRARFIAQMRGAAESAKIALSQENSANIEVFGILRNDAGQLVDIDVEIGRTEFEGILAPLVERLTTAVQRILTEIGFTADLIDEVLMVGGSSQIPCIQQALARIFTAQIQERRDRCLR